MKAAFGTASVKEIPSRSVSVITIEIPSEHFISAVNQFHGKNVLVTQSDLSMPFGIVDGDDTFYGNPLPEDAPKEELGPLAKWAVMMCKEPEFWKFLSERFGVHVQDEKSAKFIVCDVCGVSSRKEIDTDTDAKSKIKGMIIAPWNLSEYNPYTALPKGV